jgi:4-diphosphocytidyl-2-C-methyl-D-erythritol kinase
LNSLSHQSPAKINLLLRVGARRPDGYHEIESLVAQIPLYDTVAVADPGDGRIAVECDDPAVPPAESNLAAVAARELSACCGVARGARIRIEKRIPAGAGLGGGSSNAAATLRLTNELWRLGLTREALVQVAARVGSDVPLFLHGPIAAVRGRGEIVTELGLKLAGWVVLVVPAVRTSTRAVYAAFDRLDPEPRRPGLEEVLAAAGYTGTVPREETGSYAGDELDAGKGSHPASRSALPAEVLAPLLYNDLEPAAMAVEPALARLYFTLARVCEGPLRMTGSGSAMFCLKNERREAEALAVRLAEAAGGEAVMHCLAWPATGMSRG